MNVFFDLLITTIISITVLPAVILLYSRKKRKNSWEHRHKKISLLMATLLLLAAVIITYGSFIEPRLLTTRQYGIDLPNTEDMKIVFVSDLHAGKYKQTAYIEKMAQRIISLRPDLVILGGDQVDNEFYNPKEFDYLKPLEKVAKAIPTFAINGNHEYGIGQGKSINDGKYRTGDVSQEIKSYLEKLKINYLQNKVVEVKIHKQRLYIFGGDEYWSGKLDWEKLSENLDKNIPSIAIIHNPEFIFSSYPDANLVLSGHTHGGQIRFPFIGPLGRASEVLPTKFYQGLFQLTDKTKLLVSSGIGESGVRARLFNPPEIILLNIK